MKNMCTNQGYANVSISLEIRTNAQTKVGFKHSVWALPESRGKLLTPWSVFPAKSHPWCSQDRFSSD